MDLFEGATELSGVDKVNSNGRTVAPLKKHFSNSQSGTVNVEKMGQKDSNARQLEMEKIIGKNKQIEFGLIVDYLNHKDKTSKILDKIKEEFSEEAEKRSDPDLQPSSKRHCVRKPIEKTQEETEGKSGVYIDDDDEKEEERDSEKDKIPGAAKGIIKKSERSIKTTGNEPNLALEWSVLSEGPVLPKYDGLNRGERFKMVGFKIFRKKCLGNW